MKLLMRETFINPPSTLNSYNKVHHLEEESVVVPLAMTNLLQGNVYEREDDVEENEELTTSCANSELSLHNAPITPTVNIGNANGATLTDGENCFNVLDPSTNHAIMEQLLVEPSFDLSLSHYDLFVVPCPKDELLFANASVLHVLVPNTCAESRHIIHTTSDKDEL